MKEAIAAQNKMLKDLEIQNSELNLTNEEIQS